MPNASVRVIARVMAKSASVEQVRSILIGVVDPTRAEAGCLSYQLFQNLSQPADFTFVEEWTSAEAERAHFATPHISDALRKLAGLLAAEPDIRRYTLVM